jgi:hypothetical protein
MEFITVDRNLVPFMEDIFQREQISVGPQDADNGAVRFNFPKNNEPLDAIVDGWVEEATQRFRDSQ